MKITLNYPKSAAICFLFQGTQDLVRNSRGKRAISVRAIEVLLYMFLVPAAHLAYFHSIRTAENDKTFKHQHLSSRTP